MNRKPIITIGTLLLIIGVVAFGLAPGFLIPAASGQSTHWTHVAIRVYWVAGSLGLVVGIGLATLFFSFTNCFDDRADNKTLHSMPR
jgi:hypothetical protein